MLKKSIILIALLFHGCAHAPAKSQSEIINSLPNDENDKAGVRYHCEPITAKDRERLYGKDSETFVIFVCKPEFTTYRNEYAI